MVENSMRGPLGRFFLGEPENLSPWRYGLRAYPMALIPSFIILGIVLVVLKLAGIDPFTLKLPPAPRRTIGGLFVLVVFAPVFETFLLAFVLNILTNWIKPRLVCAAISAVFWGAIHGLSAPIWFFGTVWSFFVFSCAFLAWKERSFWAAFAAASLPHALINLTMFLLMMQRAG
jgi:membrane protease YdiL (CAAX protease family)